MTDWISTPIESTILRGVLELERTARGVLPRRLPARARRQFPNSSLSMVETQPTGVRLAFRTRATAIELDVLTTRVTWLGAPAPLNSGYDLRLNGSPAGQDESGAGNLLIIDTRTGAGTTEPGPMGTVRFAGLPAVAKDVEIWLPHTETVELIALRTDAPIEPIDIGDRKVWLHHGSSISHGANADYPTGTWPALAATLGQVELVNLSLRGNALLDPFVARSIRDTPADLISVKIGINLANTDLMRLRGFGPAVHGFLDTIRDGHPGTPLLVVSPILCPIQEDAPGPITPDLSGGRLRFRAPDPPAEPDPERLTLNIIREELAAIIALRAIDDPDLHYLDGRELYGAADFAELPLPDALHPDTAGHRRIAENFARTAFSADGPFGVHTCRQVATTA
ncbi:MULTISPECIES: GDSL-type esterase/lipase family protein [unclassified Nocardia]|uniref:GDSL-type esterase/lipase family protein n=1 Tax=unclassified Nocardia TaxID=2637762 RepID=UPI001CE411D3|nr:MULTISPECIES: GDSL-type esterase/lipase family protein [unclassified Nocardia]